MDTLIKKFRRNISAIIITSAVLTLAGALGMFIAQGYFSTMLNSNLAADEESIIAASITVVVCLDLVRFGAFGMFFSGIVSVVVELFGNKPGKTYSVVLLLGSILGFVGTFLLSIQSIMKKVLDLIENSYFYTDSYDYFAGTALYIDVACVFAMISALLAFVAMGIKSVDMNRKYAVATYPQQVYPEQINQSQGYPYQTSFQQERYSSSNAVLQENANVSKAWTLGSDATNNVDGANGNNSSNTEQ